MENQKTDSYRFLRIKFSKRNWVTLGVVVFAIMTYVLGTSIYKSYIHASTIKLEKISDTSIDGRFAGYLTDIHQYPILLRDSSVVIYNDASFSSEFEVLSFDETVISYFETNWFDKTIDGKYETTFGIISKEDDRHMLSLFKSVFTVSDDYTTSAFQINKLNNFEIISPSVVDVKGDEYILVLNEIEDMVYKYAFNGDLVSKTAQWQEKPNKQKLSTTVFSGCESIVNVYNDPPLNQEQSVDDAEWSYMFTNEIDSYPHGVMENKYALINQTKLVYNGNETPIRVRALEHESLFDDGYIKFPRLDVDEFYVGKGFIPLSFLHDDIMNGLDSYLFFDEEANKSTVFLSFNIPTTTPTYKLAWIKNIEDEVRFMVQNKGYLYIICKNSIYKTEDKVLYSWSSIKSTRLFKRKRNR